MTLLKHQSHVLHQHSMDCMCVRVWEGEVVFTGREEEDREGGGERDVQVATLIN